MDTRTLTESPEIQPAQGSLPVHGPTPEQFDQLFPFHFVMDGAQRLLQIGHSLSQLFPGMAAGQRVDQWLTLEHPLPTALPESTTTHARKLFVFKLVDRELRLRGQMMLIGGDRLAFIGSPWITDVSEAKRLGVDVQQLPLHDSSLDLIQAVQAQRIAASDHQRLVLRLKQQKQALQTALSQLRLSEAEARKLAHVAARTHNAVVITNPEGLIEWVNEGFTRLTGYASAEVLGLKPGALLQGPQTSPETVALIRSKLSAREGFRCTILNYAKEGRKYWVDLEVQPVRGDAGEVTHFIAIEQDVTDRIRSEENSRLQQEVSTILAESDALDAGLHQALRSLAAVLAATDAGCWSVEQDQLVRAPLAFWQSPQSSGPSEGPLKALFDRTLQIENGRAKVIDQGSLPQVEAHTELIVLHCRAAGRNVATMAFSGAALEYPADERLDLLSVLANLVGQFVVRTQTRQALEQSRNFALQVMSLMGQGLTVTNAEGHITFANDSFAALVGVPAADLIGRSPMEFSEAEESTLQRAWEDRAAGKRSTYEIEVVSAAGNRIPVWVTGVPRLNNGQFAGSIAVVTDLTEQKRVQNQMSTALERERELNRLKSSFVTMASHEFRTPLTGIVYAAEMLASVTEHLPEDRASKGKRYVGIILDSAHRMSKLMNDLLLLGRIESGRLSCNPSDVDLRAVCSEITSELNAGAQRIQLKIEPGFPNASMVDASLLRHALVNLLSNAIKYSPANTGVEFSLSTAVDGQGNARLVFAVRDFGCGIPEADQQRIFQPFFRASNVGKIQGTGVGLTIARDCARLHSGELGFVSTPGSGTTFTVSIPNRPPASDTSPAR